MKTGTAIFRAGYALLFLMNILLGLGQCAGNYTHSVNNSPEVPTPLDRATIDYPVLIEPCDIQGGNCVCQTICTQLRRHDQNIGALGCCDGARNCQCCSGKNGVTCSYYFPDRYAICDQIDKSPFTALVAYNKAPAKQHKEYDSSQESNPDV